LNTEVISLLSNFIAEEYEAIKSNMRMDKCYAPILIESLKLMLGINGKLCTYRDQNANSFFGCMQCFDLINILDEFEAIFRKMFNVMNGNDKLIIENHDVEEDLKRKLENMKCIEKEDEGIFVEAKPVMQKRIDNLDYFDKEERKTETKPSTKIYIDDENEFSKNLLK
jgi:hypothetical protein